MSSPPHAPALASPGQDAAIMVIQCENEALDALAQAVNARGALELELGGKIEEVK